MPQVRPTGAAIRAREFRRSASLFWECEGFETDNLVRQSAGMRRAATLPLGSNTWMEKGMRMSKFVQMTLNRHARPCAGHPRLGADVRRGWPGQARP